jgi:NAD(P)-dependent dehydrogenase (short-subunit alcohol dehydrogenase family)
MGTKENVGNGYIEQQKAIHKPAFFRGNQPRAAIVVGSDGESNIGFHITEQLKNDGIDVVSTHFCEHSLDLYKTDSRFLDVRMDCSEFFQANKNAEILVLCNGTTNMDWIEDLKREDEKRVLEDILLGSINATSEFVRATINSDVTKYIVFIGSMAYRSVLNGSSVYCAAKAGLAQFMKCAAWELAPKGYRVFAVHPSNTYGTPMTEETIKGLMRYRNLSRQDAEAYWGACLPMDHWLSPGEIAVEVLHLVSGDADYLSGSNIEMAGGQR